LAARARLQSLGIPTRVVSCPCWALFEAQDEPYRLSVIGRATVRLGIEAGVRQGWDRFIGEDGVFIGMNGFGASAPFEELYRRFGITAEAVTEAASEALACARA
jgi:transketolase